MAPLRGRFGILAGLNLNKVFAGPAYLRLYTNFEVSNFIESIPSLKSLQSVTQGVTEEVLGS